MKRRRVLLFLLLSILLFCALCLSICVGTVSIPLSHVPDILFRHLGSRQEVAILCKIRLPRTFMAALLGGALALSGFLLQTYFQNPIAGPFVLGISSGAKMMVACTLIIVLRHHAQVNSWTLVGAAFVGALLSTAFILVLARRVQSMTSLLVAGIMIGYVTSAVTDFLVAFATDADIVSLHGWSQGSFSGMSTENCIVGGIIVGLAVAVTFLLAKPIGAYQLGESYARSMGVNTELFRPLLIFLACLLAACVAAFAGPVSFIGIAVPFLIKRCLKSSAPLLVIPACFLGGAIFCLLCDVCARTVLAPMELNISIVTSLVGAPIVIIILLGRHKAW